MSPQGLPGRLKDRVAVQQKTVVQDAAGFEVETWATVKLAWADIEPLTGREFFEGQTVLGTTSARVFMRYDPVFSLKDTELRLVDDITGETWEVESVLDRDNRRWMLELMATKSIGGGQP